MTALGLVPMLASTNYSAIVRPLQWIVVILIWLFFLRVIRAVWVEVRPAGPRQARAERRRREREERQPRQPRRPLYVEILEPEDYRGTSFDIDQELTIGRSPGCGVSTSYDIYSSTLHARIFRHGDQLFVEDMGSTNGTYVNSERISQPERLSKGDLLQVGATVFEVVR